MYESFTPIPSARAYPLVGNLPELARDPITFFLDTRRTHGDTFRYQLGPRTVYFVAHPDDVKHVLQDNYINYRKHSAYDKIRPLVGDGLLTSEGESWLKNRRLAQPVFHRQRIGTFAEMMTEETLNMMERWRRFKPKEPFDLLPEMMRLTLTVVGRSLFSKDIGGESDKIGAALTFALHHANARTLQLLDLSHLPTPSNVRFNRAVRTLDDLVYSLIAERRTSNKDEGDLLSMLLHAKDADTGESMSDRQLRDEVMTLFLAGHETTANALSWLFYLLSKHALVTQKLFNELDSVLGRRTATLEDAPALTYTRQVIDEGLRLYPPAWLIGRQALRDDRVGGAFIPAGSDVAVSPLVTQRHPEFWSNPEGFDPARFNPEYSKQRHRFAYFPFGGGPRVCIGNNFALLELTLTLATVLQRFELHLASGYPVEPHAGITLRPKNGVFMTLKRRG